MAWHWWDSRWSLDAFLIKRFISYILHPSQTIRREWVLMLGSVGCHSSPWWFSIRTPTPSHHPNPNPGPSLCMCSAEYCTVTLVHMRCQTAWITITSPVDPKNSLIQGDGWDPSTAWLEGERMTTTHKYYHSPTVASVKTHWMYHDNVRAFEKVFFPPTLRPLINSASGTQLMNVYGFKLMVLIRTEPTAN